MRPRPRTCADEQEARARLADFMSRLDEGKHAELFAHEPEFRIHKTRGLIRLILSLSEYHAC